MATKKERTIAYDALQSLRKLINNGVDLDKLSPQTLMLMEKHVNTASSFIMSLNVEKNTYVRSITTADVVNNWGPELILPNDNFKYAVCNIDGIINWDTTRLVGPDECFRKRYKLRG